MSALLNKLVWAPLCLLGISMAIQAEQPRLVVLIAVDQLRPDRLHNEMAGGLGRLMREGYVATNATLDHGLTNTCPGHVVMSTGVNPTKAGIPGNSYIDHETMADRYCVDDSNPAFQVYGAQEIRSPNAITATTLGSWMKAAAPATRVFSVSGKDRAAITLGGRDADGAYWYSRGTGNFTSSGYYGPLPDYVAAFNGQQFFDDGYAGSVPDIWEHNTGSLRADDYVGESRQHLRVSGHPLNQGELAARASQYYFSPYLDIATLALARRVMDEEELGQRGVTDYLSISFSSTDLVGHLYGPFSAESEHALDVLDQLVGELLDYLDETLDGNYLVALSSDHGVQPLPEWLVETDAMQCPVEGGRLDLTGMRLWMAWHLYWNFTLPFGNPMDLVGSSPAGLTVNAAYAESLGYEVDEIVTFLEAYFESQPYVVNAWTGAEIEAATDATGRLFRQSYVPGKSGHLMLQMHETCLAFFDEGTSHGSVYDYDRRVPLIFFGDGIASQVDTAARHSIDIAPTIAELLNIEAPSDLDGSVIDVRERISD